MPTAAPPTPLSSRALAPDLARGALLLFIAVANAPWYLWTGHTRGLSAWPIEASSADRIVQSISLVAIDGRSYPMFAALFGYGIWQLYSRQLAAGADTVAARRLLQRRHAWMIAFGLVHAALLWGGDILGAYGLFGLVVCWFFLECRDRTLAGWAIVLSVGFVAYGAVLLAGASTSGSDLGIATADYRDSIDARLLDWFVSTPFVAFLFVVPIAVITAILAARHRVLENPADQLPLLRGVAISGITVGWIGGGLVAAQNADVFGDASLDLPLSLLQNLTGLAAGLGYVALFGLIAARIRTPGRVTNALRQLGSRSLTFYLAQSLAFAPVMSAWGLGLGAHLSSWSIALYAVAVWLVSLAAVILGRRGIRGPAETLLRWLSYRAKRSTTAP